MEKDLSAGEKMFTICSDLFPVNRSLSGEGVRQTLKYIKNILPELCLYEEKSGNKVFDWEIPPEWNVREAYIETLSGQKIADFKENNLRLVGYSEPVNKIMTFAELESRLYSYPPIPEAIPYVTSYYKRNWGFCFKENELAQLSKKPDEKYHVVIDSTLNPEGVLNYGDITLEGDSGREILFSTYICHPSMANNELSGISAAVAAALYIKSLPRRKYSYRFVFAPETIGTLIYLNKRLPVLRERLEAGFVLTCLGDDGDYSCVHTPYGDTLADRVAAHALKYIAERPRRYSFLERGSDERQYCSPLVALPVCVLSRTLFNKYKEYHTSLDNLSFISPEGLQGGFNLIKRCIDLLELNGYYKVTVCGEPQLGKRGLYPATSTRTSGLSAKGLTNFIAYCDGKNDLIDIAEIIKADALALKENIYKLIENDLLIELPPPPENFKKRKNVATQKKVRNI